MRILPAVVASWVSTLPVLLTGVLALAAFNLGFRLDAELVREWDESLYATTAWEMLRSGDWIGTTFHGTLDYYNTKPPLFVWLITLSFKTWGVNLIALRLTSVVSAWLTMAVLVWWVRTHVSRMVAVAAGLVLATTFGFFHPHAGRTANTDALFTLLILLTVVTLWSSRDRPWQLITLGPILAAVFLLRGMGVLMPLAIVLAFELLTHGLKRSGRWLPTAVALVLFVVPVAAWVGARWQVDEWEFLTRVFWYDFVARSVSNIESHPGSSLYYLNILQKHHYDWLAATLVVWIAFPVSWAKVREVVRLQRADRAPWTLLTIWALAALLIPTAMQTKLPWYLHPFYPVFAIGVGALLTQAWSRARTAAGGWKAGRPIALVVAVVLAVGVAEGKLLWFSYHNRDLRTSAQGLLVAEQVQLRGRAVFRNHWDRAEIFVVEAMVGAAHRLAPDVHDFLRDSHPGDFWVASHESRHPALALVRAVGRHHLYRRTE